MRPDGHRHAATFSDPGELATDVTVDRAGNLAALADVTTNFTPGDIAFYDAGSTSPSRIVTGSLYTSPRFGAFDKKGNLALDDDEFNTGTVNLGAIRKGGTTIVPLTFNNRIVFPGGVQFATTGQLLVLDQARGQGSGEQIYTYNVRGQNLGSPVATTVLQGSCDPIGFALTANDRFVLTADTGGPNFECGLPITELYHYPESSLPIFTTETLGGGQPTGAAIVPTEQFALH